MSICNQEKVVTWIIPKQFQLKYNFLASNIITVKGSSYEWYGSSKVYMVTFHLNLISIVIINVGTHIQL